MSSSTSQIPAVFGFRTRTLPINREVSSRKYWLFEKEVAFLLVVVIASYFARLSAMSIRGEESRWATVACEMMRTGDWAVPRQQGVPHLSRPPLLNWLIAATTWIRGDCDPLAVRLPSVIAILLTTLMIYGYSRNFLSRLGAFSAGLAFATMGQVLQLGRLAETEAVFTLFVSASLLVWHWGYVKEWPGSWTWTAGYFLAALGALAKGQQAPTYFIASVGLFLLVRRDWRMLLCWSHLLGIIVFSMVIACWQIPFYLKLGSPGTKAIWMSDTAMRLWEMNWPDVGLHLLTYPLVIMGCTLPWSLLLLAFLSREIRQRTGEARPGVFFLVICLAVTFPSCWLVPGARGRYFMPLFPCLAPLIGLVVQRCVNSEACSVPRRVWQTFLMFAVFAMITISLAVISASWSGYPRITLLAQDRDFALVYGALACVMAGVLWWISRQGNPRTATLALLTLAGFLSLTQLGLVVNFFVHKNGTAGDAVSQLKVELPAGQELVSFGRIHHLFAYHFRDPIALRSWPRDADDPAGQAGYFCFQPLAYPPLPFPWEKLAAISCDRDRTAQPEEVVIVGRRLDYQPEAPATAEAARTRR